MGELGPYSHSIPAAGGLHLVGEGRWTGTVESVPRWRVQNQDPVGTSLFISCQPGRGSGCGQCGCEQQTDPSEGRKLESEGSGDPSTKGSGFQKRKGAGSPLSWKHIYAGFVLPCLVFCL